MPSLISQSGDLIQYEKKSSLLRMAFQKTQNEIKWITGKPKADKIIWTKALARRRLFVSVIVEEKRRDERRKERRKKKSSFYSR